MSNSSGSPVVNSHRRIANCAEREQNGMEEERERGRGGKIKCAPCALYRVIIFFAAAAAKKKIRVTGVVKQLGPRLHELAPGITQPRTNISPLCACSRKC